MLLKCKCKDDVMLTEIGDATINSKINCIEFKPLDNALSAIRLRNTGSIVFDRIVDDLFEKGKADITYLGDVEFFTYD